LYVVLLIKDLKNSLYATNVDFFWTRVYLSPSLGKGVKVE